MKAIPGYEGLYSIDEEGNIYSYRKGRLLQPFKAKDGYFYVDFHVNSKRQRFPVQHLVLLTFVGDRPEGTEACHNNGIRTDNRLENLRWDTRKVNAIERNYHGTQTLAKINVEIAKELRQFAKAHPKLTQKQIGKHFGISQSQAGKIINGKQWIELQELYY